MFCPRCSREIEDGSRFCNHCGYEIVPEPNSLRKSDPAPADGEPIVSHSLLESQYDLKWYKFLIWFFIWFQAFINLTSLIELLSHGVSGALIPGLGFSAVTGVLYIVYLILTRQALAHWKTYGPALYLISVFCPFVLSVLAVVFVSVTAGPGYLTLNGLHGIKLVFAVVLFVCNRIYFNNRAALFTE